MSKKKENKQDVRSFDLKKFRFLYDHVLVRAIKKDTGIKGLVRPDQYDDKPEFGEVISVGEGRLMDDGTIVPINVKPGDIIFFSKYSSEQTRTLGEDYYIIRADDIRAVL